MTDTADENPFIHPAQKRFQELLDEAEELAMEQTAPRPLHDPLEPYHLAQEWGVDPWVLRMIEADRYMTKLRAEAQNWTGAWSEESLTTFKEIAVGALQGGILYEEQILGDPGLDDQQLAVFLDKLRDQLDARIKNLRWVSPDGLTEEEREEHQEHVHLAFTKDEVPLKEDERDEDVAIGLAYQDAHPAMVAGEGSDGTPSAGEDTGPMRQVDAPVMNVGPEPSPAKVAGGSTRLTPDRDPGIIQVEEVDATAADQSHDFAREGDEPIAMPPPVDLDAAERALAREIIVSKMESAGSTGRQFQGRHASPEDTDPDMGETGRRAKED